MAQADITGGGSGPQPEPPRLLAQRSEYGYTSQEFLSVPREPEAISEDEQRVISIRARTEFATERMLLTQRRDRQMWLERLRKAEQRAADKGVDIFRPQSTIRQQILAIEKLVEEAA